MNTFKMLVNADKDLQISNLKKALEIVKEIINDELEAHGDSDLLNDALKVINAVTKGAKTR